MTGKFKFLTLGCTALVLAACSQTPAPTPASGGSLTAGSPYAGGQQFPWSDRLDAPSANPYADGRAYPWASPIAASSLNPQALNAGWTFLSELQWTSATSGWGPVERDGSNGEQDQQDGTRLSIGGRVFASGLGVHAASEIRYALGGQCSTFSALVGIDDEVGQRGSAQFRVYGDGTLLFDSGLRRGGNPALALNVSVAGVKELRLSVSDGGDNNYYDHADWAQAAVECAAAPPTGDVFLSDLPYVSATNGWGPVEFDRSNGEQGLGDGRALTIGGRIFDKGLGVHAFSVLSYDLGGRCNTFSASLGLDDEVGDRGSVVFQVYGDDRKLYDSGVLRGHDAARSAEVGVSGVNALQLIVTDAGDSIDYDHANWADARLTCAPAAPTQSGALDPSFGSGGRVDVGGVDVVAEEGGAAVVLGADFKLTRLSPSGAVLAQGAALSDGVAHALARQVDGKLVAVGQIDGEMAAVRYLSSLTLDSSFGAGGVVRLPLSQPGPPVYTSSGASGSGARDVALQPDGKIVLGGHAHRLFAAPASQSTALDFALVRLQADGSPDASFGQGGTVFTAFETLPGFGNASYFNDDIYGLALQDDGKIVAAGLSETAGSSPALLARYLPDGRLDATFSGDGIALGGRSGYAIFRAVAVRPDGQIIAGGADARFFTAAFLQTFGPDGTDGPATRFQFSDSEEANFQQTLVTSLVVDNDSAVLVGGLNAGDAYVAHFTPALRQDTTFGGATGGNVRLGTGNIISLVNSADNTILVTTASRTATGAQDQGTYRLYR
ncbi:hypothetical protein GCM10010840_01700 [Deinococcus aerolatus]|uniref:Glycosyl hydrolase family 98 putative carbohydrate-binding module domain-containing protein n=1 Tax=Deinococcus aerolatus TaxID=522487 RepID=A0ABQ2FZI5_9DEIO|nr:NPCBM/NEW2 domain-containing protein [Deinococcus aerolatus]GGL67373.1 hypothetical protein GCM10010840_01700 [Deinococcus aerolatus]